MTEERKEGRKVATNFFDKVEARLPIEKVKEAYRKGEAMSLQYRLKNMRQALGVRQEDMKGFSQVSISKIEKRKDMRISTLIEYLNVLGVDLEIIARPHKKVKDSAPYYVLLETKANRGRDYHRQRRPAASASS